MADFGVSVFVSIAFLSGLELDALTGLELWPIDWRAHNSTAKQIPLPSISFLIKTRILPKSLSIRPCFDAALHGKRAVVTKGLYRFESRSGTIIWQLNGTVILELRSDAAYKKH